MKRFAFTLQRMLNFKKTLYDKERNTLARLRAERLTLQGRRDEAERQIMEMDVAFREKAAEKGVRIDEVQALAFHKENADFLIDQLEREIAEKDVEIERQFEVVVALDKEVKSLEKLRERQWEEYAAEAAREERERILEIVSGRYVQGAREAAGEEVRRAVR